MPRGRRRTNRAPMLLKSAELIGWAIGGIEREISQTRERLAALTAQANKLRGRVRRGRGRGPAAAASFDEPAVAGRSRRRRRMSAAARKRISQMMKKRWAERKRKGKNRL